MNSMKLILIIMGCILSIFAAIVTAINGFSGASGGVLVVGIILIVVGVLWKNTKKESKPN